MGRMGLDFCVFFHATYKNELKRGFEAVGSGLHDEIATTGRFWHAVRIEEIERA